MPCTDRGQRRRLGRSHPLDQRSRRGSVENDHRRVRQHLSMSNCGLSPASPTNPATALGVILPALNPGGEIVLECDRDKWRGLYPPVGDSAKPVNLFVSVGRRHLHRCCCVVPTSPADTIVIRDKTPNAFRTTRGLKQRRPAPRRIPIRDEGSGWWRWPRTVCHGRPGGRIAPRSSYGRSALLLAYASTRGAD